MSMNICGAPCCWGVDDVKNPYLPAWQTVLKEASLAGYRAIELGPYGYLPIDIQLVSDELSKNNLSIVAGTIFDDLVSADNYTNLLKQTEDICSLITKLPPLPVHKDQHYPTPYMTIMDWGHDERDYTAGHSDKAPRLSPEQWSTMVKNIIGICKQANKYGVRPVIHPHAGGYIEFADEMRRKPRPAHSNTGSERCGNRRFDHQPIVCRFHMIRCFGHHGRVVHRYMHVRQHRAFRLQAVDPLHRFTEAEMARMRPVLQGVDHQNVEAHKLCGCFLGKSRDIAAIGKVADSEAE